MIKSRAFTMIEMIVVLGIIGLVLYFIFSGKKTPSKPEVSGRRLEEIEMLESCKRELGERHRGKPLAEQAILIKECVKRKLEGGERKKRVIGW